MKKCYLTFALLAACAMWGVSPMQAETVSPYTEDFENLVLDPQEDFAPPKWGRIVGVGADFMSGNPDYVDYEYTETGGAVDGQGYLSAGSQNILYIDYVANPVNDILITPAVTGAVSFYLKKAKGAFVWLGVADGEGGSNALHTADFYPSEKALPLAMQMLANIAVTYLNS